MADNLRTRIAAAIDTRCFRCARDDDACKRCQGLSRTAADAVIRELGLEVERGGTYEVGGKASSYRYVTDWKADNTPD
jgi:hypothetical protein